MTFLAAIAALVALVWCVVLVQRLGIAGGLLAVLFCGSVWGHAFYHVNVGPLPLTSDRVLLAGLCGVYLLFRCWGRAEPKNLSPADWALLGLMLVLTLSTLTHAWQADGAQPLATLLFFYGMPFVGFWLARQSRLDAAQVTAVAGFLILFALYLAITAVAEVHQQWWLVYPGYIGSSSYEEFFGRARGPFLNPIACGMYLTVGIATLAAVTLDAPRRYWPAAACGFVLLAAGLWYTKTRSVWLAAAAALLAVLLTRLPRRHGMALVVTLCLAGLLMVSTQWEQLNRFKRDRDVSVQDMSESASLRPILAMVSWRMFQDQPVWGCGFGQYRFASPEYLGDRSTPYALERARGYIQHNLFLSVLVETGLVGIIPLVIVLAWWASQSWQLATSTRQTAGTCQHGQSASAPNRQLLVSASSTRLVGTISLAALVSYMVNGMFHEVAIIPMSNMLLFFCCGLCGNLASRRPVASRGAWSGELRRSIVSTRWPGGSKPASRVLS